MLSFPLVTSRTVKNRTRSLHHSHREVGIVRQYLPTHIHVLLTSLIVPFARALKRPRRDGGANFRYVIQAKVCLKDGRRLAASTFLGSVPPSDAAPRTEINRDSRRTNRPTSRKILPLQNNSRCWSLPTYLHRHSNPPRPTSTAVPASFLPLPSLPERRIRARERLVLHHVRYRERNERCGGAPGAEPESSIFAVQPSSGLYQPSWKLQVRLCHNLDNYLEHFRH